MRLDILGTLGLWGVRQIPLRAHLYIGRCVREAFPLNPSEFGCSCMAIYHCAAKVISRSQGRSAVAAAAYRAGCNLHDERLGLDHKYARKKGVTHSEIMAPLGAPAWVFERQTLWNEVEAAEKRKDSQLARDFDFALPVELTPVERRVLIQEFVQEQFVDRGMIADYSIHEDNPQNPHFHLMTTMRTIDAEGFGLKEREWNDKDLLKEQRAAWSDHVNQALEQAGHDARVDHRSFKDQGVDDRLPQIHLGVAAAGMIERAAKNETILEHPRVDRFREIQQFNDRVVDLDREIAQERARLAAAAEAERRLVAERQRLAAEAAAERQRLAAEAAAEAEKVRLEVEAERQQLVAEAEAERVRLEAEAAAERGRLEAERRRQTQQRQEWGSEVYTTAALVLEVAEKTAYEGKLYRFVQDGDTLTVEAKDGRGVLVKSQGDQPFVSDQLTEADWRYCRDRRQKLEAFQQQQGNQAAPGKAKPQLQTTQDTGQSL